MNEFIHRQLLELYRAGQLEAGVTPEMLAPLAKSLGPTLRRYQAKEDTLPNRATLRIMANNFLQDGPLVQSLLNYGSPEAATLWSDLHLRLTQQARRQWFYLDPVYRDKIIGATYLRIYRYLPNFLFKSRLDTWIYTILKNEFLRLRDRIEQEHRQKTYLDKPLWENMTLADYIPAPQVDPLAVITWQQALDEFWQRLDQIEQPPNPEIFRLHMAGYKLHEIQAALGENSPALSTIHRRIQRMLNHLQVDPVMGDIAGRLGFLAESP